MACWARSKIDQVAIALTAMYSEDRISMTNEEHNRAERGSARVLLILTRKWRGEVAYQEEEKEVMRPTVCAICLLGLNTSAS